MSLQDPPADAAGTATVLLNQRYELGERLAEGSFFYTHRGREIKSGRAVAIKVLKPEFAGDAAFSDRLLQEAQRAVGLQHPYIASVYEAWRERGTVIIATEWVRGINLEDRIRRVAPFPLAVTMDILLACAEALAHAHQNGFVHGDVRPDNIIITPDGQVKMTDFGVGVSVAASKRMQLSALPRAVYYLAPELAEGRAPDARSDQYALGCTLHEMLAGATPFQGDSPLAIAAKHLHEPLPSLTGANPSVPNAVDGMARRCMQKDPAKRYPSLAELLQDVRRVREALRSGGDLTWSPLRETDETVPATKKPKARSQPKPRAAEDGGPSVKLLILLPLLAIVMVLAFFGIGMMAVQGPPEVRVPPVIGQTREQAIAQLQKSRLKAEVREEYHSRAKAGEVFDAEPKPGTDIRANRTVLLYVSRGAQPILVPDVTGEELDAAQTQIQAKGLLVGPTREEFSDIVEKGKVISQTPAAGAEVSKRSPVQLVVSKGQEPSPEPEPVDVTPDPGTEPDDGDAPPEGDPAATPDTEPVPSPEATSTPPVDAPEHRWVVDVTIPRSRQGPQRVRILTRNEGETEDTIYYDQNHKPGETIKPVVATRGSKGKCLIRVYINGVLVQTQRV